MKGKKAKKTDNDKEKTPGFGMFMGKLGRFTKEDELQLDD